MAKFVATDYVVSVGGTDLSSALNSVELSVEADDIETTTFGAGYRTRIGGLKQASVTLNFLQDFGAGSVDATTVPGISGQNQSDSVRTSVVGLSSKALGELRIGRQLSGAFVVGAGDIFSGFLENH